MRSGAAVSLGVAVAFGAIAVVLARSLLPEGSSAASAGRTVVVASQPLGFGVALTSETLKEIPWPASDAPDGTFATIGDVVRDGRRLALTNLQRNEPILTSKVTGPNQRATLSTQIEEGMRAVSIRVDEVRGVAGFVLPGDRVDVILTRGEGGAQEGSAYADVLLQYAKVLAIDQVANERQDKPAVARAVTLELNIQQAQKVILAQGVGRLSLILRQTGGPSASPSGRVTAGDLGPGDVTGSIDRLAGIEKRIADLAGTVEQATSRRMSEMENRLRGEMASRPPPFQPMAAAPPALAGSVVNVTRNGSKREQYTVVQER